MKQILYITTFNQQLYDFSGKNLCLSFTDSYSNKFGDLVTCYEGGPFIGFDIMLDGFVNNWREQNREIIPMHVGGYQIPCRCNSDPIKLSKPRFHKKGCYFTYWNRNVYKWFMKIAALHRFKHLWKDYKYLLWLDCDCIFKRSITVECLDYFHNNADIFYFKGPHRQVEETGIISFRISSKVIEFLNHLIKRYTSGLFRKDERWDDCFQFQQTRKKFKTLRYKDLGLNCKTANPIPESEFGKFICHYKGTNPGRH